MELIQITEMLLVHRNNVHPTVIIWVERDTSIKVYDVDTRIDPRLDSKFSPQGKPQNLANFPMAIQLNCVPMAKNIGTKRLNVVFILLRDGSKVFE
nr:hypothetical protein [Loktanella sp. Alg231-35]